MHRENTALPRILQYQLIGIPCNRYCHAGSRMSTFIAHRPGGRGYSPHPVLHVAGASHRKDLGHLVHAMIHKPPKVPTFSVLLSQSLQVGSSIVQPSLFPLNKTSQQNPSMKAGVLCDMLASLRSCDRRSRRGSCKLKWGKGVVLGGS